MPERATGAATYDESIFFNCPFDDAYKPIFEALVFAVFDCGYVPRCGLEAGDAGQARVEKILAIICGCRFGAHNISRTELDGAHALPGFNMPFELGLFLGAARFGAGDQRRKVCLVLERERYCFQKFISDIAGQDIREHGDDPERAIAQLRAWLAALPRKGTPSRWGRDRRPLPRVPQRASGHPRRDGRPPPGDGLRRLHEHRFDLALGDAGRAGPGSGAPAA